MTNSINSSSFEFSEEKCFYYTVLKELIYLRKQGEGPVSAFEIQENITYFKIPINQIEGILDELYDYSLLTKQEMIGEEARYTLDLI